MAVPLAKEAGASSFRRMDFLEDVQSTARGSPDGGFELDTFCILLQDHMRINGAAECQGHPAHIIVKTSCSSAS